MSDKTRNALEHIVDYCDKIEKARARLFPTRDKFDSEDVYQDVSAFYIQQIGEFVNDLSGEFIANHPQIQWHQIRGFRNIIAHAYDSVESDILWDSIEQDIPQLKLFCEKHLQE